jgi:hypothetical protein
MVMHITMYKDEDRIEIVEYRDFFTNRKYVCCENIINATIICILFLYLLLRFIFYIILNTIRDYLEQRRRILTAQTVWEMFGKGRAHGLKECILQFSSLFHEYCYYFLLSQVIKTPDQQTLAFIPSTRIDGLANRVEYFGKKVGQSERERDRHLNVLLSHKLQTAETYEGRDDFLIYRCVAFSNDKNVFIYYMIPFLVSNLFSSSFIFKDGIHKAI